jgi:2-phospho-L-lactate/phosphoenolpyruvate guanylyltransferase
MDWTAVVPLKQTDETKSRLGAVLQAGARADLVETMVRHVLTILGQEPEVRRIVLLSPVRPPWWSGVWEDDGAAPLNDALDRWRRSHGKVPLLVIHGDLPYLTREDIAALLAVAARAGAAMATDVHGTGTNAIALADDRDFEFRFGPGSRAVHAAAGKIACVERPGLARDIDLPADLAALIEAGVYSI